MRIISQNGEINLPYDLTAIFMSGNHIQAVLAGSEQKSPYLMASYSSKENCEKAVRMLNNTYIGAFYGLNIDIPDEDVEELTKMAVRTGFGVAKIYSNNHEVKFEPANIMFKFPEDGKEIDKYEA